MSGKCMEMSSNADSRQNKNAQLGLVKKSCSTYVVLGKTRHLHDLFGTCWHIVQKCTEQTAEQLAQWCSVCAGMYIAGTGPYFWNLAGRIEGSLITLLCLLLQSSHKAHWTCIEACTWPSAPQYIQSISKLDFKTAKAHSAQQRQQSKIKPNTFSRRSETFGNPCLDLVLSPI